MSKATISAIAQGTTFMTLADGAIEVRVNNIPIAILTCGHQADWMCTLLNRARESKSKHESMNILTQQLSFCDAKAESLLAILKGEVDTPVPDDIREAFLNNRPN